MQKHLKPEKSLERQGEMRLGLVEKITAFVGGVFISPLLIAFMLKIIPNFWGGFIGSVITMAAGLFALKTYKKPLPRTVALGMISAVLLLIVGTMLTWIFLMIAFRGISK
jgi:ABC-type Fe3+ transport system permease subunit